MSSRRARAGSRAIRLLAAALLGCAGAAAEAAPAVPPRPEIRLEAGGFVARDLPQGAVASDLAVFVGTADSPMLGDASLRDGVLRFVPRFPLEPGLVYRAVLRGSPPVEAVFEIPRPAAADEPPRVTGLYPSSDRLPENLLKIYLQFSAPMSRGEVYQRLRLVDAGGQTVEAPFLELEQELWDPSGTRVTVLFDPGRIKRGLVPNQDVGLPLVPGQRYALVVDPRWASARGTPLSAEFRKEFAVVKADREPLDPRRWTLRAPAPGGREPLVVSFPEPLDRALLGDALLVRGAKAAVPLAGTAAIERGEREWQFRPVEPWTAGDYLLAIDPRLEDLAGNRIGRLFDVDRVLTSQDAPPADLLRLPFQVR